MLGGADDSVMASGAVRELDRLVKLLDRELGLDHGTWRLAGLRETYIAGVRSFEVRGALQRMVELAHAESLAEAPAPADPLRSSMRGFADDLLYIASYLTSQPDPIAQEVGRRCRRIAGAIRLVIENEPTLHLLEIENGEESTSMSLPPIAELVERLLLSASPGIDEELSQAQVRLAAVLARLWTGYAEVLEVRRGLLRAAHSHSTPVPVERFHPGETIESGGAIVRTDPRLALADRLGIEGLQDQLGALGEAVLKAPELAKLDLLAILPILPSHLVVQLAQIAEEQDTDEFPARPVKRDHS